MEGPKFAAIKIVFLGESGTGKSSLITRFVDNNFNDNLATTIGASSRSVMYPYRDQKAELTIWDTAGQERYRALTPMYYRSAIAAVIVFDITSRDSFVQVQGWINELQSNVGNIVIVICGNKHDLEEKRAVQAQEGDVLAESVQSVYCETSAMTGFGVDYLFQMVVRRIAEHKPEAFPSTRSSAAEVVAKEQQTDGCGC